MLAINDVEGTVARGEMQDAESRYTLTGLNRRLVELQLLPIGFDVDEQRVGEEPAAFDKRLNAGEAALFYQALVAWREPD